MKDSLSNSLIESLDKDAVGDFSISIADSILDIIAEDGSILNDIPFISMACSVYKIGRSVVELNHVRQLLVFINEIRNKTIDDDKREAYKRKFSEKNEKDRNKELEYIILITARFINPDKSKYLALLYTSYIDQKINWDEFVLYTEILDRFLPGDIETLERGDQLEIDDKNVSPSLLRLCSLGLFTSATKDNSIEDGYMKLVPNSLKDYHMTSIGRKMRESLGFTDYGSLMKEIDSLENRRNGRR